MKASPVKDTFLPTNPEGTLKVSSYRPDNAKDILKPQERYPAIPSYFLVDFFWFCTGLEGNNWYNK